MATIGGITVPTITPSGTFPLTSDFGAQQIIEPIVVEHQFGSANAKITQRFYLGTKAKRFRFVRSNLSNAERISLRNFWETNSGGYGAFTYLVPEAGGTTTSYTCCFENEGLAWDAISQCEFSISLTLVEIPTPSVSYSLASTVTRFPGSTLSAALLSQVQEIIPLIKIQPLKTGFNPMFLSDRECTVGSQFYPARLLDWGGISQAMGSESDDATFTFGNADGVMTAIANSVDLNRARIEFSLFHVGTGIKVDLWAGDLTDWDADEGEEFHVTASDGLYDLNLPYPTRRFSRTCWKDYNDGLSCPASSAGGTNLGTPCDKGFDTPAGCVFHNMQPYHGGIMARPQAVFTKDNSTGVHGFGRGSLTSVSLVADSIYDEVVPEIYTDIPMPVNCKIVAGRDEGDFYVALGVVGEGPIGEYGVLTRPGPPITDVNHTLDGINWHGYPKNNFGLRRSLGHDPAANNDPDSDSDKFSLGEGGAGIQSYGPEMAAGTAFIEIRKSDEKGLQLSRLAEHEMQAIVSKGMSGWIWTAPGTRTVGLLTNPSWIVVNALLRARGQRFASAATAEQFFDVTAAIAFATVCDTTAPKLIGTGTEKQFTFTGILQEAKPLRDWITEILMNALGGYSFSFGKLRLFSRYNSSAVEAFTAGNMVFGSLKFASAKPQFNHLTANFGDAEFEFVNNSVSVYDIDHAKQIGGAASPLFLKSTMNLSGSSGKSQVARIVTTRLREEVGGITEAERLAFLQVGFRTTILALNSEVGQVDSIAHPRLPGGAVEFRVQSWKLNKDYSIDISGRTTTDSMYNLTVGIKPADVVADPVPNEEEFAPADWNYEVRAPKDGKLIFSNFSCATNPSTVVQGFMDVYYIDEANAGYTGISANVTSGATTINFFGAAPPEGSLILIDAELILVKSVAGLVATVTRAQLGTIAAAHTRVTGNVSAINSSWKAEFNVGTGKAFRPGNQLVAPDASQERIGEYNSASGLLRTLLPIASLANAQAVYSDPRIWFVQVMNVVVPFQPRFFKGPNRADFIYTVVLPYAGIVLIDATLQNTRGISSENLRKSFTATFPHRLRTLGTTALHFRHPNVPTGTTEAICTPAAVTEAQPFERAYCEFEGGTANPIQAPRAISSIFPANYQANGAILLGGTFSAEAQIHISFSGSNNIDIPMWVAKDDPSLVTLSHVATSLANWLNGDPQFLSFYTANPSGSNVQITDLNGIGGVLEAETNGTTLTLTPDGLTSALGVLTGRKYATAFTGGGYRSELSALSLASPPTGGALIIGLHDLPVSADVRVTNIEIYAAPDGIDSPLRLIANLSNGTESFTDTYTEASLAGQSVYAGATQPPSTGTMKVMVERDGNGWFDLVIPVTGSRSNIVNGLALTPIAANTVVTIDTENNTDSELALSVVIE